MEQKLEIVDKKIDIFCRINWVVFPWGEISKVPVDITQVYLRYEIRKLLI